MHTLSILLILTWWSVFAATAPTPDQAAVYKRASIELFPNLIINVDKANPGAISWTGYTAEMSPTTASVFSFDIPYDINPTCTLSFTLPAPGGLFRYTVAGSGMITASPIYGGISNPTSYDAVAPHLGEPFGSFYVTPTGGVGSFGVPCDSGSTLQVVFNL
jgi:Ubiquitin 3 binding protein But2 C-terminal domain